MQADEPIRLTLEVIACLVAFFGGKRLKSRDRH